MNRANFHSRLDSTGRDRNAWRTLSMMLAVSVILLVVIVFYKVENIKTVLTPVQLRHQFWVQGGQVSPSYLEEIAYDFQLAALNVSPSNVDYQHERFLKYTCPQAHGEVKTQLASEAERLKRLNASQIFFPRQVHIDTGTSRVAIEGEVSTLVNGQKVNASYRTYRVGILANGGNPCINEFVEVKHDDPFELKKPSAGNRNPSIVAQ